MLGRLGGLVGGGGTLVLEVDGRDGRWHDVNERWVDPNPDCSVFETGLRRRRKGQMRRCSSCC